MTSKIADNLKSKYGQPEFDAYCDSPALGLIKSCYAELSKAEFAYLHGIVHNVKGAGDKSQLKKSLSKIMLSIQAVSIYYGIGLDQLPPVDDEELEAMV